MESRLARTISRKEELDILLSVYRVKEGYLFFNVNLKQERRVAFTLDCLVNRGFIRQADRRHPPIYGEGTRYYVGIKDKGKEVVRKLIKHYNSLIG